MIFLRKNLGVDQVQHKLCQEAVSILEKFATDGRVPLPRFDYQQSAHRYKKPKPEHIVFCRFSIPEFLRRVSPLSLASVEMIIGAGRDEGYEGAKSLAALEVLHRLDEHITGKKFQKQANRIYRPFQGRVLWEYQKYKQRQHHQAVVEEYDTTTRMPLPQEHSQLRVPAVPGASWHHLPYDPAFERPNSRSGRIEFTSSVRSHREACIAAKVITLVSRHKTNPKNGTSSYLPSVTFQTEDQVDRQGKRKRVITADIVTNQDPYSKYSITGTKAHDTSCHVNEPRQYKADGPLEMMARSKARAIERALVQIYNQLTRYEQNAMVQFLESHPNESLGMAKLFVEWPSHHATEIQALLQSIQQSKTHNDNNHNTQQRLVSTRQNWGSSSSSTATPTPLLTYTESEHDQQITARRIETLRKRQQEQPLPIDSVESQIQSLLFPKNQRSENIVPPENNDDNMAPEEDDRPVVTLVYGGTGSGKSTRVPLLLSLLDPNPNTRVIVAQPRRLACQASAERVAYEQGYTIGYHKNKKHPNNNYKNNHTNNANATTTASTVPIGYAVRFDSQLSRGKRTVDFCTPGVLLRWAIEDELLGDVTHLGKNTITHTHARAQFKNIDCFFLPLSS
jgi:signal recognition particle GTPase